MARRASLLGKLLRSVVPGRRKAASGPLLLDRPVDRDQRYNAVTQLEAKFQIGQVVRHRHFPFRGIIFDVDPVFANTDEWYESIPEEVRPRKDQPFYHLLAENSDSGVGAAVGVSSETNGRGILTPWLHHWSSSGVSLGGLSS